MTFDMNAELGRDITILRRGDGSVAQVLSEWEGVLLDQGRLPLKRWIETGAAQVVKQGEHRTVYRVDLPERRFFVKHYHSTSPLVTLKQLVRRSASRREWHRAREIARRRIPTVSPVAIIEETSAGVVHDSFLVTEAIPDSVSLQDWIEQILPTLSAREQSRLTKLVTRRLAILCAEAHESGILHDDFHPGNVLMQLDAGGDEGTSQPRLFLIDVPKVKLSGPLGWRKTRQSLVQLGGSLEKWSSRFDRARFWREYLSGRPSLRLGSLRRAAALLENDLHEQTCRIHRGRDSRPLRTNREFVVYRGEQWKAHAVRDFTPREVDQLLDDPAAAFRRWLDWPLKLGPASAVVRGELHVGGQSRPVCLKRYRPKHFLKAIADVFRRPRAVRSWQIGQALVARGIPTARPLLAIAARKASRIVRPFFATGEDFLATEWIEGGENFHLYGWQLATRSSEERFRRACQVAESLGRLVGEMHRWHIAHRDLKGCNILLVERADSVDSLLVDLDGVRIRRELSDREAVENLARLATSLELHPWISNTMKFRFLRAYRQARGATRGEELRLWRLVEHRAARRSSKKRAAGRMVA